MTVTRFSPRITVKPVLFSLVYLLDKHRQHSIAIWVDQRHSEFRIQTIFHSHGYATARSVDHYLLDEIG